MITMFLSLNGKVCSNNTKELRAHISAKANLEVHSSFSISRSVVIYSVFFTLLLPKWSTWFHTSLKNYIIIREFNMLKQIVVKPGGMRCSIFQADLIIGPSIPLLQIAHRTSRPEETWGRMESWSLS